MTLHDLINDLTQFLSLTPEQQFRVTAKIKRLIHVEKHDVYSRYAMYAEGPPIYDTSDLENPVRIGRQSPADEWLHTILTESAENHAHWASKTDEEIVTWDVGSHVFKQEAK